MFVSAPGQQSIDSKTITLCDLVYIPHPTGYVNQELTLTIRSDVNGVSSQWWDASGGLISGVVYEYAQLTGQFANFAKVYATYRLDHVQMDLKASSAQAVMTVSPSISAIDTQGQQIATPDVQYFAQCTSVKDAAPYTSISRMIDYVGWLVENTDHPYLNTDVGSGVRETYATALRSPGIAFMQKFTILGTDPKFSVCLLRVQTRFTFRGLRQFLQTTTKWVEKQPIVSSNQNMKQVEVANQPQSLKVERTFDELTFGEYMALRGQPGHINTLPKQQ